MDCRVVITIILLNTVRCHEWHQNSEKPKYLWNYYGKAQIDLQHVLQETKNIIKLHEDNKLALLDAAFYYHRLHDFNTDGFLDGLEMLYAAQHSALSINVTDILNLEQYATVVDAQLKEIDFNNDGFIDFPEFADYLRSNSQEVKQDKISS